MKTRFRPITAVRVAVGVLAFALVVGHDWDPEILRDQILGLLILVVIPAAVFIAWPLFRRPETESAPDPEYVAWQQWEASQQHPPYWSSEKSTEVWTRPDEIGRIR